MLQMRRSCPHLPSMAAMIAQLQSEALGRLQKADSNLAAAWTLLPQQSRVQPIRACLGRQALARSHPAHHNFMRWRYCHTHQCAHVPDGCTHAGLSWVCIAIGPCCNFNIGPCEHYMAVGDCIVGVVNAKLGRHAWVVQVEIQLYQIVSPAWKGSWYFACYFSVSVWHV